MAKVEDEIYQPGSLGGAPMAQKMDRVCNMTMAGTMLSVNGEGFLYNPASMTKYEAFCMVCCGATIPNMIYQNPDNSKNLKYSFSRAGCCESGAYSVATKLPGETKFSKVAKAQSHTDRAPLWFALLCCDPCHGLPVPGLCCPLLCPVLYVAPCLIGALPWGQCTDCMWTTFLSENTLEYAIKGTGENNKGKTLYTFHNDEKGLKRACAGGLAESQCANCTEGFAKMKPFRHVERTIFVGEKEEGRKPVATVKRVGMMTPAGPLCAKTYTNTHIHVDWTDKQAMAAATFDDYAALSLLTISTRTGLWAVDSCIGDSPIGRVTNTLNLESTKAQPDKRHGFVTFEEFMPSIGDGMMDTGDLIPKIQAMSRK